MFDFLGYQYRPRRVANTQQDEFFCGYTPAVSPAELKTMRATIKSLNIPRQTPRTLAEIAQQLNPLLRGWIAYYGRFSRSALSTLANYVNQKLRAWIMRKFKRFQSHKKRARLLLRKLAHKNWGCLCTGKCSERIRFPDGSGVNREVHAPFCERPAGEIPPAYSPRGQHKLGAGQGACAEGDRVIGTVPLGSWETITFVAALRHNKMTAPMVVEGAMTGEMFFAYIEQCLVSTLRRNDIVVIDNCRVHMGPAIRLAIERAHATLSYLPKYSPDLNPIELPYSKFKAFLRKVAARTIPGLTRAIRSFVPQLGPRECANYFRHVGYASI